MRRVVLSSHMTSYKNKKVSNIPLQQSPYPEGTKENFDSQTKTSCPTLTLTRPHQPKDPYSQTRRHYTDLHKLR